MHRRLRRRSFKYVPLNRRWCSLLCEAFFFARPLTLSQTRAYALTHAHDDAFARTHKEPGGFIVDDGVVLLEDCVSCSNGFMCSPSAEECTSCVNVPTLAPVDSTYRPVTTCTESEFACWNGRDSVEDGCISAGDVCDKVNDCGDNSDENGCPDSASDCQRNEFACLGGVFQDSILRFACIDMDYVCDGNNDCGDNTDEFGCPDIVEPNHPDIDRASVCKRSEFQCTNGSPFEWQRPKNWPCIKKKYVCDGDGDCIIGSSMMPSSDEIGCPSGCTNFNKWITTFNNCPNFYQRNVLYGVAFGLLGLCLIYGFCCRDHWDL